VFPLTSSTTFYNMVQIGGVPFSQPQPTYDQLQRNINTNWSTLSPFVGEHPPLQRTLWRILKLMKSKVSQSKQLLSSSEDRFQCENSMCMCARLEFGWPYWSAIWQVCQKPHLISSHFPVIHMQAHELLITMVMMMTMTMGNVDRENE